MQQNNKENRSFKIITAIALCVAVLCLSVAYATLSANLKISGTATVEKASWDIQLEKVSEPGFTKTGTGASASYTISKNVISDLAVTLKYPGDSVTINLNAVNKGDIPAVLDTISNSTISCTSADDEDASAEKVCGASKDLKSGGSVEYKVTYAGEDVTSSSTITNEANKKLAAKTGKQPITITVKYKEDIQATDLPANPVTITFGEMIFNYNQDTTAA